MPDPLIALAHSKILADYIAFEVVDEIVNLKENKLPLYKLLEKEPPFKPEGFSPNSTLGLIVDDMTIQNPNPTDPNFKISTWKDLDKTNTDYAFALHSFIIEMVDLVQQTRGYVSGVITPKAEDIAMAINTELMKSTPFSSDSVADRMTEGTFVGNGNFFLHPHYETITWGELENPALISNIVQNVRNQFNLHLDGAPNRDWISRLLNVLFLPIGDISDKIDGVLPPFMEDVIGDVDPVALGILTSGTAYGAFVKDFSYSLYTAPQILEVLDRIQILKNIGGEIVVSSELPSVIIEHVREVLTRLDIMLLCIHISRVTFFGKSYILAAILGSDNRYTILINGDQSYVAQQLGLNEKDAYDAFLYLRYAKNRMFPPPGIETSFIGEKKDKAVVWLLEQAAAEAGRQESDVNQTFSHTALRVLLRDVQAFVSSQKLPVHPLDLKSKCEKAVFYMQHNPQDSILILMNLLVSFTPYPNAALLISFFNTPDDVLKATIQESSLVLARFVKALLAKLP